MTLAHWLRSAFAHRAAPRTRPAARRLGVESLEDRTTPSTGGLPDPTFGSGGTVLTSFANNYDTANAVVGQPDGKVVIAGWTQASGRKSVGNFLVARYNPDGSLDSSFGSGGHVATAVDLGGSSASAVALQTQPDGSLRILAAGGATTRKGNTDLALVRYNLNGTLDTTFGTGGKVETDLGGATALTMAVDGSGRIVVAGGSAVLARYTANGALDTTFGTGGKVVTGLQLRGGAARGFAVAVQSDGKIALAGTTIDPANSAPEFEVARFTATGAADGTFGTGGVVKAHPGYNDGFGGVAIQADGKIVVGGSESSGYVPAAYYLLRYNPDGTPDAGFGTGGLATVSAPVPGINIVPRGSGVAVQPDGKIIAGAQYADVTAQREVMAVARVNPDGTVDAGFGTGGWATAEPGYYGTTVYAMSLEPDGRIALAGYARPTANTYPTDVLVAEFLGSAPQVGPFTASSGTVTSGDNLTLTAGNISDGNPNATVAGVEFYYFDDAGNKVSLGTGTANLDGTWTLTFTVNLPPGSYTLYAQATDSYGATGDPVSLTLQLV